MIDTSDFVGKVVHGNLNELQKKEIGENFSASIFLIPRRATTVTECHMFVRVCVKVILVDYSVYRDQCAARIPCIYAFLFIVWVATESFMVCTPVSTVPTRCDGEGYTAGENWSPLELTSVIKLILFMNEISEPTYVYRQATVHYTCTHTYA